MYLFDRVVLSFPLLSDHVLVCMLIVKLRLTKKTDQCLMMKTKKKGNKTVIMFYTDFSREFAVLPFPKQSR